MVSTTLLHLFWPRVQPVQLLLPFTVWAACWPWGGVCVYSLFSGWRHVFAMDKLLASPNPLGNLHFWPLFQIVWWHLILLCFPLLCPGHLQLSACLVLLCDQFLGCLYKSFQFHLQPLSLDHERQAWTTVMFIGFPRSLTDIVWSDLALRPWLPYCILPQCQSHSVYSHLSLTEQNASGNVVSRPF